MMRRVGFFLLALVAGYAAMIVGIFIAQEALFGGVTYQETPLPQLLIAGALTTASAAIGGAVAAMIFGKPFYPPCLAMSFLVVAESVYMVSTGQMPGPVWFDATASASLVVGILFGAFVISRRVPKPVPVPTAT